MRQWENEFSESDDYEQQRLERRLRKRLAIEQLESLILELEQEEEAEKAAAHEDAPESPARKKLKRELEDEAMTRLEEAARTVEDWEAIIILWDKRDANRERRERYKEVSRSGDDLPIDYGAKEDGLRFPDTMNNIFKKQQQKGDFIESIFNCPFELHELVTESYLSKVLFGLSDDHKEVLYYSAIRGYPTKKIGMLRDQTDRNIRKVRKTMLKKIRKKILPYLKECQKKGLPLTKEERTFLLEADRES